jgi:hypothetical protein
MIDSIWWLRGLEGAILVMGAGIASASLRAYFGTRRASLGFLGAGFVLVTIAAALAGVVYEVFTHDLLTAWIVSASLDTVGFGLILYSIVRPAPGPRGGSLVDGGEEEPRP